MGLLHWWPLNGNTEDYVQQNNLYFVKNETNNIVISDSGKIGQCYEKLVRDHDAYLRANTKVYLPNDLTLSCWAFVTGGTSTANGLITNHNISSKSGFSINTKYISSTDYRISCSTGNGTDRTWHTYYGTTNIYNSWHLLTLTYSRKKQIFKLWVDGNVEYTSAAFNNNAVEDYFDVFKWATNVNYGSNYRTKCKLNDVRVYDEELSQKEIRSLHQACILHYSMQYFGDYEPTVNLGGTSIDYHNKTYNIPSNMSGWGGDKGTVEYFPDGGYNNYPYKHYHKTHTGTGGIYSKTANDINIEAGKTYTMSIYVRASRNFTDSQHSFNINRGKDNRYITCGKSIHFTTEWQRISRTFKASASDAGLYGEMSIVYNDEVADYWVEYSGFQIEEKDHATPFVKNIRIMDDNSGYRHNGKLIGSAQFSTDTPIGDYSLKANKCLIQTDQIFFDNINQCHTVSFWVKPTEAAPSGTRTDLVNFNSGYSIQFSYNNNKTLCYLNSGANDAYVYGPTLPLNEWTMVTWLVDTKQVLNKVYYNGVFKAKSTNYTSTDNPSGFKTITTFLENFIGYVTDIKIFASILTDTEIDYLYRSKFTFSDTNDLYCAGYNIDSANTKIKYQKESILDAVEIVEPMTLDDGSMWIKLMHHDNKHCKNLFSKSYTMDDFKNGPVYQNEDAWACFSILNNPKLDHGDKFEFLLYEQPSSTDDPLNKQLNRWIQNKNPFDSTFADTSADKVTVIAGTTRVHGLYNDNYSRAVFVGNNATNGNWWGSVGCNSSYGTGIPGYNYTNATRQELYVRVYSPIKLKIFKPGIVYANNFIER